VANRVNHQEIVKRVLEAKAIDFAAIGRTIAEVGPSLALADEPWEGFCGTMRRFIIVYRLTGNVDGSNVENLAQLGGAAQGLGS
jgi:hypothetical protein